MAAARPQSSQLIHIYLIIRAAHLRLLWLRMFALRVGRQWEMGKEGRTGQERMLFKIVWLQLIRYAYVCAACLWLDWWANREQRCIFWNGTQNLKIYMIRWRENYQLVNIFFVISLSTVIPNAVFSPPITPYPTSKSTLARFRPAFLDRKDDVRSWVLQ